MAPIELELIPLAPLGMEEVEGPARYMLLEADDGTIAVPRGFAAKLTKHTMPTRTTPTISMRDFRAGARGIAEVSMEEYIVTVGGCSGLDCMLS